MGGKNFLIGSSVGVNLPQKIALLHFQNLLQKGWKIHTSSGTFWSKIHSKGLGKLNLTVFKRSKCVARFTCASQKPYCWSSLFDWMPLNNDRLPSLLNTTCCWTIWLTISNQTEAISRTVFWLACVNLTFWPFKNCEILIFLPG